MPIPAIAALPSGASMALRKQLENIAQATMAKLANPERRISSANDQGLLGSWIEKEDSPPFRCFQR
jgi:hypothetical protein